MNFKRKNPLIICAMLLILVAVFYVASIANSENFIDEGDDTSAASAVRPVNAITRMDQSSSTEVADATEYSGVIRFHAIANSDSEEDQALKLKVRDGVLAEINKKLAYETMLQHDGNLSQNGAARSEDLAELDIDEARRYIAANLDEIKLIAEQIVRDEGYDYEVSVELGVCWIPEKTYGSVTFPAGNYEALNIKIGSGSGQNWWCVLFPPLCIIDPDGETLEDIETDSIYGENVIKLRFKSSEIIKNFFK